MKLLQEDPRDTNVRLKIGDLHLKLGETEKAIAAYSEVALQFSRGGFDAKAVAIYKQILRVDEGYLHARVQLGEHFHRMGLVSDALREYQQAIRLCEARDLKSEAFDLLKKVAALNPGNVANRLSLADLMHRQGLVDDAREQYVALLEEVSRHTSGDMIVRVAEQMIAVFPDHIEARTALANARVSLGDPKRAVDCIVPILERFPGNVPLREALVNAYEALSDDDAARDVYRELAELYKQRGDHDRARDIQQRFVAIGELEVEESTSPSILLTDPSLHGVGLEHSGGLLGDIGLEHSFEEDLELVDSSTSGDEKGPALAGSSDSIEDPEESLAEARVALEFGDVACAERVVRSVLDRSPDHEGARALLQELVRNGETSEELPDVEIVLVDEEDRDETYTSVEPPRSLVSREDRSSTEMGLDDDVDPNLESLEFDLDLDADPAATGDSLGSSDIDLELDIDLDDDVDVDASEGVDESESSTRGSEASGGSGWGAESARIAESLEEAAFFLSQGMSEEAEQICRGVIDRAPAHPQALVLLGEILAARNENPDVSSAPIDGSTSDDAIGWEASAEIIDTADDLELEEPLRSSLELEIPSDVISSPANDVVFDGREAGPVELETPSGGMVLHDVSVGDAGVGIETALRVEDEADDSFDLAAELESEELNEGIEEVFRAFKRGIQEQLGDGDAEAHYDLAIAYKEMGLLEDAVREAEIVVRSGTRGVEARALAAQCKIELGRPMDAAHDIYQALERAGDMGGSVIALRYELGEALLAAGKRAEALEAFQKVASLDSGFREVAERIGHLR